MDRFIGQASGITYDIIIDLKSNMDRFIGRMFPGSVLMASNLKSNMDRFIVLKKNKAKGT